MHNSLKFAFMKRSTSAASLLLSLCLFFSVAVNAQKKDDFNIPEDLGKTETTILVPPATSDKITESILEAFEDNYKGKYQAIADQYPKSSKYSPDKYQYIFIVSEKHNPAQFIGRDRFPATTDYKFGLMDMKTGKRYEQDFWSGSYKKGAKAFINQMEEIRKKNAGS
jgi:hypothetical protein